LNDLPSSSSHTAKGRYSQLESLRDPYLTRARDAALVTLPHIMPPMGHTPTTKLYTPYQGLGARGVNNLASKLLLTMFPANSPFFRYDLTARALQEMEEKGMDVNARGKIDNAMSKYERAIQKRIESGAYRPSAFPAMKHIIITGNVLIFIPKKGPMRVFPLDQYVVKRDASGNVIEIITLEKVSPLALSANVRSLIPHHDPEKGDNDVELYTWIRRTETNWTSVQYVDDIEIPDTQGTYPLDRPAYIALRWNIIDGEDYGRGYVEDYIGDLYSLEGLSQAIVEGSAAAARVIIMVKPGSPVTMRQLAKAPSGTPIVGNKDDVGVLQLEKFADFRVARETIEDISKRISYAFLLNTAVQRTGERVTAEEIRYMAQELESALGGTYSVLSQELQLNFLRRIEHIMQSAGELPKLPKEFADPTIITGLEALGRGQDLAKYRGFIQMLNEMGPNLAPMLLARINIGELVARVGAAATIDMEGLVLTEEEVQAEQAKQQQQQMMQSLGPQAITALGGMARQKIANQGPSAPPETETPTE
jgi:hypothetical protein